MGSDPQNHYEQETVDDFGDVARVTRTFLRYAKAFLIAAPLWMILLVLFPFWGLTEGASFLGASVIAGGFAIAGARMFARPDPVAGETGAPPRRRLQPPGRVTLVVLTLVIVLYVVLVNRGGG